VGEIEGVDEPGRRVFFTAQKRETTETGFHSVRFNGRGWRDLTKGRGTHRIEASPSARLFVDTHSALDTPPRMRVIDRKGRQVRLVSDTTTPEFQGLRRARIERFTVDTDDGLKLPVLWYLPPGFERGSKKYPLIVKIYGGPGAAVVRDAFPRRLTDYYLAQQDIIVMYMDHRGAGHHGKIGMDMMHRSLGKWEIHDLIQVVGRLGKLPFIDAARMGISGGSYGGYVAALAMTRAAEYFKIGIADFSVIDWRLYDSVYTERYMDTPDENPEGYKNASVLTHMTGYRGGLRLTHGSLDDNVHMQNTMQFLSAALSAGKTVELMIYPGERHGFRTAMRGEYNRSSLNFWLRHFFGRGCDRGISDDSGEPNG
jgi:dipeptidyl-peptidase-4